MINMKKFVSLLAAVLMISSFATFGAYAEAPQDNDDPVPIDMEDENEDEDDEEPDYDDIEVIDGEAPATEASEDTEAPADAQLPDETEESDDTTEPAPEEETAPPQTPDYIKVDQYTMYATEVVNVRYGPDTSYSKFGQVYANSPVTVLGYSGGWLAIQYNGTTGFVSSSFFTNTAPETTTATAATTAAPADTQPGETEPQQASIEDTLPAETTAPEDEAETTKKTKKTKATESTETTDDSAAAAVTDNNTNNGGGLGGILIALASAVGTFLLVGVIPVVIHRICHNKLYQY